MIVGAGVAGLTAASLLAHNVPATIFEANDKVGGCCASATLDGFTFHDGAVFLGIIDLLDHAFARIVPQTGRTGAIAKNYREFFDNIA